MAGTRKTAGERRGGCTTVIIVCVLLAAAGFLYLRLGKSPPPPELEKPSPGPIVQTPPPATPSPTPTVAPTPLATPPPTPQPTPTPEAPISLRTLGRRQLPLRIALTRPVQFEIIRDRQRAGVVDAPVGAMVGLAAIRSDESIDVQFGQIVQTIPVSSTDLLERVRVLLHYTAGLAPVPTPARFAGFAESKAGASAAAAPVRKPVEPLRQGTLIQEDFEAGAGWAGAVPQAVGTIDLAGSKQPSLGLRANESLSSGPLAVHTGETDLGKLTLAFSLSASAARPVRVCIESFDENRRRTGGLETLIYPAAPDFYQRYALDLSSLKPSGSGRFDPESPFVGFTFSIGGNEWKEAKNPEIRLDNVHYAKPAFYVSAKGSDQNNGRSPGSAFARPQKALDESGPGDIILVMEGTYDGGMGRVATFPRAGTPAGWIVLKNYPGQKPTFKCTGWDIIMIGKGSKTEHSDDPSLAYLEVRGLHLRGEGDVAKKKYPEAMDQPDSRTNTNGLSTAGRYMTNPIHHIRFADNLVEYCPAGGISAGETDWVTIENNVSRCNSWTTIYGTSGISTLGATNFDATDNVYKILIRNNVCYRNETYQICLMDKRLTDGNGIIIDVNQKTNDRLDGSFLGRTLVQNNVCYDNGGSGIHTVRANRVDIINNTCYLNSASKNLQYPEIFTYGSEDVRISNNILVAPVAPAGEKPEPVNKIGRKDTDIHFTHNLYFGGNIPPTIGQGDTIGDPHFVNPSVDPAVADFHLKPDSTAVGAGFTEVFSPFVDFDGKQRANRPSKGAYEK